MTDGRREITAALDDRAHVIGRRPAASADHLHAELGDEAGVELGELVGGEIVMGVAVHDARQARVRQHRDRRVGVVSEMAKVLGHLARAGCAVEPEDVGLQRAE